MEMKFNDVEELLKERILGRDLCETCDNYDEQTAIGLYGDVEYDFCDASVTPDEVSIVPSEVLEISLEGNDDCAFVTGKVRLRANAVASVWSGDFTDPDDYYLDDAEANSMIMDLAFTVYVDENGCPCDVDLEIM